MSLRQRFQILATKWHNDTAGLSSPSQIAEHEAYQEIINMGPDVIPLILEELRDRGGHWYIALRKLVSDPPIIDPSMSGRMKEVRQIWVDWGRAAGYQL